MLTHKNSNNALFTSGWGRFWNRAIQYSTPTCRARFESTWSAFTASVVEQARDRESGRIRSVEEHMAVRRFTIGAEPCYALAELGLSIPSEVYNHPALRELRAAVTDIIIYDNVSLRSVRGLRSRALTRPEIGSHLVQQRASVRGRPSQHHHDYDAREYPRP